MQQSDMWLTPMTFYPFLVAAVNKRMKEIDTVVYSLLLLH
jgi:hypothetical protein